MRTKLLYQEDSYIKEFEAKVLEINGKEVVLDQTAFHNGSGGVEADTGYFYFNNEKYEVIAGKKDEETIHILNKEPTFKVGDIIKAEIDWEKRYRKMRLHTATHIISALMYQKYKALVTGGNISSEYAKDDYSLNVDSETAKKIFEEVINEANEIAKKGLEVKVYWLSREEALKIEGIVKLANRMPPNVDRLRIVEIEGIDVQADGEPHVKNTKEIGTIKLLKVENKGKDKKRIYFTVD
ncbi:MAG: alanyl-tRNA editing protein AlaXM [Candidatus Aenigmatarchaeota archaeon]